MIKRAENCGAQALVVTLDTTVLGCRPRDLNLGSLPFARGQGIAQYTSHPRFGDIVGDRIAAAADRAKTRVSLGALRTLVSMSKHHPGTLSRNLRSPKTVDAIAQVRDHRSAAHPDSAELLPMIKTVEEPAQSYRPIGLGGSADETIERAVSSRTLDITTPHLVPAPRSHGARLA